MSSGQYIKARGGPNSITVYYTKDNRLMIRSGGTWTWRNNNPGNMRSGNYSKNNGCIGYSGGFAVFPTLEQGEIALRDLLKNGYKGSSLLGWVEKNDAIALSENHKIDGVVARSSTGSLYIKTRHDMKITNNLGVLG